MDYKLTLAPQALWINQKLDKNEIDYPNASFRPLENFPLGIGVGNGNSFSIIKTTEGKKNKLTFSFVSPLHSDEPLTKSFKTRQSITRVEFFDLHLNNDGIMDHIAVAIDSKGTFLMGAALISKVQ